MGYKTCRKYPGTYGHIETDAQTFAEWGIDMVKMDKCNFPSKPKAQEGKVYPITVFLLMATYAHSSVHSSYFYPMEL